MLLNSMQGRMDDSKDVQTKVDCKYWDKCYQKNPAHRAKYNHPAKNHDGDLQSTSNSRKRKSGSEEPLDLQKNSKKVRSTPSPLKEDEKIEKPGDSSTETITNLDVDLSKWQSISDFIKQKFLVEMPRDFYKLYEFCEKRSKGKSPEKVFEQFGLKLVGPFECLSGALDESTFKEANEFLRHWRFYYDPPEFQTILVKKNSKVHFGYWRDDPKDKDDLLVARNDAKKGCEFNFVGGNCFETIFKFLNEECVATPFNQKPLQQVKKELIDFAADHNIPLDSLERLLKKRNKKVVCKTFHRAGIVVPFDRKTEQGYRSLVESDIKIRKILSLLEESEDDENVFKGVMESLQPIITAANIAVDECDFGTSIELGLDLFCSGFKRLHNVVEQLLATGYSMVNRPEFIQVLKAHLECRNANL